MPSSDRAGPRPAGAGAGGGGVSPPSDPVAHHHPGVGGWPHIAHHSAQPEFARGAVAAAANVVLTFPLNKLISRQAYEGITWREALHTMKEDGPRRLYRGVAPPLLQRALSLGVMFGMFDFWLAQLRQWRYGDGQAEEEAGGRSSELAIRAAAGVLAGSTEGLLAPFERVQTLLQHHRYTHILQNTLTTAKSLANHGPREFYRGFTAILLRNGPANALWFSLRDPVRDAIPASPPWNRPADAPSHRAWGVFRDFVGGAVLGAGISTVFYPVNVVKSVMQLDVGTYHRSFSEAARAVVRDRGWQGLYTGVHANALRSLLSWGVINSVYELTKDWRGLKHQHAAAGGHNGGGGGGGGRG
jgi:hypothetical protein